MIEKTTVSHWDTKYENQIKSAWTENHLIAEELYRRMTGGKVKFWLDWLFTEFLTPVQRLLSVGCGNGAHEILLASSGYAKTIDAFDASPVAIDHAKEASDRNNLGINFVNDTFDGFLSRRLSEKYDAILFSGSLHHVARIEEMLAAVKSALLPRGVLIINEYVGPCYQLYPKRQLHIINDILIQIDPAFKIAPDATVTLPTMDAIMANDPTEGVRSALIETLIPRHFEPLLERHVGGGLLHPIFDCLSGQKINDRSIESQTLVKMLIAMENQLTKNGVLDSNFLFGVYRK